MRSLSRRQFALMAGAGLTAGNPAPARQGKLTAGEVVERIKKNIGVPWNDSTYRDTFKIGGLVISLFLWRTLGRPTADRDR